MAKGKLSYLLYFCCGPDNFDTSALFQSSAGK